MKPPSIVIDHFLSTKWSKKLFTINHYELQNGKCIVTQELSAYNIFTILSLILIFMIRNQEFILKGGNNVIDYSPLWKTMEQRNISQYYLVNNGIDYRTMHQLRNNKNITAHTIEKLCRILDCTPNDILTFTNDDTK